MPGTPFQLPRLGQRVKAQPVKVSGEPVQHKGFIDPVHASLTAPRLTRGCTGSVAFVIFKTSGNFT